MDIVFLLDLILKYHHTHHKPMFIASVDVAKAFDTVSHRANLESMMLSNPCLNEKPKRSVCNDAHTTIVSDS